MYTAFSDGSNTLSQIAGASALVSTRRRDKRDSALESFLLQQLRILQLVYSLHARKRLPEDIAVPAIPSRSTYLDSLLELAFQVPPYLQSVDNAAAAGPRVADSETHTALVALEDALLAWLRVFRASRHCRDGNYVTTEYSNSDTSPKTPDKSFLSLTSEALCQICLLLISECQDGFETSSSRIQLTAVSELYAAKLRMTTIALLGAAGSLACRARAVRGPLHFLDLHYTRCRDEDGLRWCAQTKVSVCKGAPYLCWDGLLPWSLMSLTSMPG
jgi:hypothetical protein